MFITMGGVKIAHQHVSNEIVSEDNFSTGFPGNISLDSDNQVVDNEQLEQILANAAQWPTDLPVEDLTGEVQDLMMRESMNSWLQPWVGENEACLTDFDTQIYAQSMQLGELFGQDQLNFAQGMNQSAFYDELAFAPDDAALELSAPCSSASSPSDSSAQISPIVQPITDIQIDQIDEVIIVEKLEALEQEQPVDVIIEEEIVEVEEESAVEELVIETPSELVNSNILKRRRSSTSSEDSSDDSSSEEESDSEDENVIPTTVANMNNRRRVSYSSSSDSDSDTEPSHSRRSRASSPIANPYIYMHKRQIEETLLDRITNNLSPEKLPGILPILQSEKASSQQEDEVEIDLSCLAREQLVQVLSYVDACILEQNGGPAVNVEHYIMKKPTKNGPRTRPALNTEEEEPKNRRQTKSRGRKPAKPKSKSLAELTEEIDGDSSSSESVEYDSPSTVKAPLSCGPMSMASLSKKTSSPVKANNAKGGRKRSGNKSGKSKSRRKGDDDATVSSSVHVIHDPDSIASSRPKRRAAIHKRRLLEEMLVPSDNEADEDSEDSVLVVYSDEQMDLDVVDNRTIMHQADTPLQLISTESEVVAIASSTVIETEGSEGTDEEIDIMC